MPHNLTFEQLFEYDDSEVGITVPITLQSGNDTVDLAAKIDTGSTYCIFERGYGEILGLDIESGDRQKIGTATVPFTAYGHELALHVFGWQFDGVLYFPAEPEIRRNVLGRHGWLEKVQVGIVDYERKLYLNRHGDTA